MEMKMDELQGLWGRTPSIPLIQAPLPWLINLQKTVVPWYNESGDCTTMQVLGTSHAWGLKKLIPRSLCHGDVAITSPFHHRCWTSAMNMPNQVVTHLPRTQFSTLPSWTVYIITTRNITIQFHTLDRQTQKETWWARLSNHYTSTRTRHQKLPEYVSWVQDVTVQTWPVMYAAAGSVARNFTNPATSSGWPYFPGNE